MQILSEYLPGSPRKSHRARIADALRLRFAAVVLLGLAVLLGAVPVLAQSPTVGVIRTVAGSTPPGEPTSSNGDFGGDGGPAISARLFSPAQVAVDKAGNFYIADDHNNVVRKVDAAGIITTVAGNRQYSGPVGDGGPATDTHLDRPSGVAVDNSGNLYISDTNGASIRKVSPTGIITTLAGNHTAGYFGDGGLATSAQIWGPMGIAVDAAGNVYFADSGNNVVRKVANTGIITTVAGYYVPEQNVHGYSDGGGVATMAQLYWPEGVALDSAGNLYIADSHNYVIRKVTPDGHISTVAGLAGSLGCPGNGVPAASAPLGFPIGLSLDASGNLYIADQDCGAIEKLDTAGNISIVAGHNGSGFAGDGGPAIDAVLDLPTSVTVDAVGNLYISDTINERIRKITQDPYAAAPEFTPTAGSYVGTQSVTIADASPGAAIYYTEDGSMPTPASNLYSGPIQVSATETIQAIAGGPGYAQSPVESATFTITANPQIITTVAGNGSSAYPGDGGRALAAGMTPGSVAVYPTGDLYFADQTNCAVRRVTPAGTIFTVAGGNGCGYSGDGGSALDAQMGNPRSVAVDASGNLYIADQYNHVVRKVDTAGIIDTFAGNGTSGNSGDGDMAFNAQLGWPYGLATDSSGSVYISDADANVVRKVTPNGTISTVAGTGGMSYYGDGGPATSAGIYTPLGLATDTSGNLYIAQGIWNVIRKVNPNGIISTVAGNTIQGYSGDGGQATSAELAFPWSVATDKYGNLYIGDGSNSVIRKVTPHGIISTIAGNGTPGFSGDGGPATSAQLNYAEGGIALDAVGNLYIADLSNYRIRKVGPAPILPPADTPVIDPPAGTYKPGQVVTITDTTPGATIYYTTDGTTPSTSSNVYYNGSLALSYGATVEAIATATGYSPSAVASSKFIIPIPPYVTWPNPLPIEIGTPLDGTQLNASSNADGTFVYTPGAGSVLGVGYHTLSVTFTPTYPEEYTPLTRTVSIQVIQGALPSSPIITTVAGTQGSYGYSGDGGPALQAQFYDLQATAVDASGNLYILDVYNDRVRKVTPDGTITTVAGNGMFGASGDDGPAIDASLNYPSGIAVDSAGNLYIADEYNKTVRKVTPDGIIHAFAGNYTYGNTGDGGLATDAQLEYPYGIAVDASDNVYISDISAGVVRKVTVDGKISTVAGNGNYSYSGDGGKAIDAGIYEPVSVAVDPSGNLYIADFVNSVVRKVDTNGTISTFAGTNANAASPNSEGVGVAGYYGDGGRASSALLNYSFYVATDAAGNVYISDEGNNVIRKVGLDGIITTVAGNGVEGFSGDGGPATNAELSVPGGIAFDRAGNFYIADTLNYVVRKVGSAALAPGATPVFNPPAGVVPSGQAVSITDTTPGATIYYTTDGNLPTTSSTVYSGPITINSTDLVQAIAVATGYAPSQVASAVYYVPVPPVITWPNPAPIAYGTPLSAVQQNATAAAPGYLSTPGTFDYTPAAGTVLAVGYHTLSVTFTPSDTLNYATTTKTVRILVTQGTPPASPIITTVVGNGTAGYLGDQGQALDAELGYPLGVAVDHSGNLYIADPVYFVIRKVAPDGTITTVAGNGTSGNSGDGGLATNAQFIYPTEIAVDNSGNLFISDTYGCSIRKVNLLGIITTVAGNGSCAMAFGDGGLATSAGVVYPGGIAVDNSGNLYLTEGLSQAVRKVDTNGIISIVAGDGYYSSDFNSGDGGPATSAHLGSPYGLATDASGNLYIADGNDNVIRKVDVNGIITTFAGNGTAGYSGDGSPATLAQLSGPIDIAADNSGNLYIEDWNNHVVRKVDSNGVITTVAGNGTLGFSGDGGPATSAQLHYAWGVALDTDGNLYIADRDNHRVRKVGAGTVAQAATPVFNPPAGSYVGTQSVSITDATPGATVYYTTNGATPTTSSAVYSGPLTVATTETINALAVAPGHAQSPVATAAYTLSKLSQTILFNGPPSLTYGQTPPALIGTASSGLPVTYFILNGPATVSGSTLTITGTGSVQIMATQAGDATYSAALSVMQFFNVDKATLTVTANDASRLAGASNPAFTYTITGFQNGENASVVAGTVTETTTADSTSLAGKYPILFSATTLISPNYTITYVPGTLTISGKAPQTITFNPVGPMTYGDTVPIYAASSSGLPVRIKVTTGSGYLNFGSTSNFTAGSTGTIGLVASQAGDGNYAPAPDVYISISVAPAVLTVIANNKTIAYGQYLPSFDYSLSGFLNGDDPSSARLNGSPTLSVSAPPIPMGGTYPILISRGTFSAPNYIFKFVNGTLTVTGGAAQTITFNPVGPMTYGDTVPIYAASSSGLPVRIKVTTGSGYLNFGSTSTFTAESKGTIGLVASQVGDGNYAPAADVYISISVAPAVLTVTANNKTIASGQFLPSFDYSLSGFLNGDDPSSARLNGSPSLTVSAPQIPMAGTYPILISRGTFSAPNYIFRLVNGTLTVSPKVPQTITFSSVGPQVYGAGPITLSASATSGLPVSYSVSGQATISGSSLLITGKGSVTVTATQAGDNSYNPATPVSQTVTVSAKLLTVSADSKSKTAGAANPVFTASYNGFVNGDSAAVLTGAPALSTAATVSSAAGQYPITAAQGTLSAINYSFAFVNGTLSIVAPPPAIISTTSTLTLSDGVYQEVITVTNTGNANASDVLLTTAILGAASGSPLPESLGNLAAGGGSATVTLTFPASAGASGATVVAKTGGTFGGGTFNTNIRVKLPKGECLIASTKCDNVQ